MVDDLRELLASYFNEQARILNRVDDDDAKQRKGRIERLALSRRMLAASLWRVHKHAATPCQAIEELADLLEYPLSGDDSAAWKLVPAVDRELRKWTPEPDHNGKPPAEAKPTPWIIEITKKELAAVLDISAGTLSKRIYETKEIRLHGGHGTRAKLIKLDANQFAEPQRKAILAKLGLDT